MGDPVMHIELRRWADVLVIAPLSANSLAKMAAGMCDNLITCIVRAWDYSKDALLVSVCVWDCVCVCVLGGQSHVQEPMHQCMLGPHLPPRAACIMHSTHSGLPCS